MAAKKEQSPSMITNAKEDRVEIELIFNVHESQHAIHGHFIL